MASYNYTASGSVAASANIATDKIRIATTSSPIQYTTSYPNVAGAGTITAATNTANVTGVATGFLANVAVGWWIGNATGVTAGIVKSITDNTSLIFTANSNVAISNAGYTVNPYGTPYTVATANSAIIPANATESSIYVGQGNVVSFLHVAAGANAAPFSVTELGMPHANSGANGVNVPPGSGGPKT